MDNYQLSTINYQLIDFAKIIHPETAMSRNVRLCPAMSRYILIKVKKNGKKLHK